MKATCKPEVRIEDLLDLDEALLVVLAFAKMYANKYRLPFQFNSIHSDLPPADRTSNIHAQKRAIDVDVDGWSELHRQKLTKFLNGLFGARWGTKKWGSPNTTKVCLYGDDAHLDHFHFQVRRGLIIDEENLMLMNI
jgi:hypothetical protein